MSFFIGFDPGHEYIVVAHVDAGEFSPRATRAWNRSKELADATI